MFEIPMLTIKRTHGSGHATSTYLVSPVMLTVIATLCFLLIIGW